MTDRETTAGGALGRLAGKIKQAAGSAVGDDELAREGRLQEARVDADREAGAAHAEARQREDEARLEAERAEADEERERLRADLAAGERERAAERDRARAERAADADAIRESAAAGAEERDALRLEHEAAHVRAAADAIDPEEKP